MKRVMAAALAVFTAAGLLAGSAFAAQENARVKEIENTLMKQIGEMPKTGGGEKLGALVISLTNPYWVGMKDAYIAAAEQYGVNIEVMSAPTEGDKQSQLETLNAMALKDYKAIVLSPIEPYNLLPGIIQCNKNGIPVINLGPGINVDSLKEMGGRLDGRLTVDFAQQGELAASDMVKRIGTGKVAIIQGIPGAAQSEGRTAGAKKVFEATKGVELVAGLKDKVLLYGVDGTEEAKTAIKEGRMDGTITYPSSAYAKAAVIMLLKLAQGMDMSQTVYCPLDVINTENVAQFDGYM